MRNGEIKLQYKITGILQGQGINFVWKNRLYDVLSRMIITGSVVRQNVWQNSLKAKNMAKNLFELMDLRWRVCL